MHRVVFVWRHRGIKNNKKLSHSNSYESIFIHDVRHSPPPPLFCLQRKPTQKLSATTCQKVRSTCQTNNIQQSFDDSRYELLHTQLDNYWKFDNLFNSFEFRKWWMAKVFSRIACNQTRTFKIMLSCQIYMLSCQIYMLSSQIYMLSCQIYMLSCQIYMLSSQIYMLTCHLFIVRKENL